MNTTTTNDDIATKQHDNGIHSDAEIELAVAIEAIDKMTKPQLVAAALEIEGNTLTKSQLGKMKKADIKPLVLGKADSKPEAKADDEKPTMAEQLAKARANYTKTKGKDGKVRTNNGDELATLLIDLSPDDVLTIAEHVRELEPGELHKRYGHLNQGQQRMNGGNMLRGFLKKGGDIADIKALIAA